ncbi:anthrone oxygenase family protein [Algoriphagus formosus]|uniref:DUF1772 domain-containing protein n=1 Tax=Algoriphagus formosus TaxID=2007308 RepID=A0A4R5V7Z6_9BACT|nr:MULTISPECIES: DUF1772 domain-containing protein [Algoriphagus]TDK47981.1 DUF1772 domain-containing protein [Algoriphagus aquimaris]
MEIQIQNISLNVALVLTGLSAGLFFAWSVSVIPGTQKIDSLSFLETMQSINREIINPAFFLVFFGSIAALTYSTYITYGQSTTSFWLLLTATLAYLFGTIGVTGVGNVPLNNELELLNLAKLSTKEITEFREYYELRWNKFHTFRMLFSVLSFLMTVVALNFQLKN